MFRPVLPSLKTPAFGVQSRNFAKATIVGRLGQAPDKREGANGKVYYRYALAVEQPPKKDAAGEVQRDSNGYVVRDTNWFSVFAFGENRSEGIEAMRVGAKYIVEAQLDNRPTSLPDGKQGSELVLREITHKLVANPATKSE